MGSDTNIIAASAALADSLEFAIWKSGSELRRRDERHFTTARRRERRGCAVGPGRDRDPTGGDEMTVTPRRGHASSWPAGRSPLAATCAAGVPWSSPPATTSGAPRPTGNGAIDALYRAVDKAVHGVLSGHPRLLAYDIHALGEGTDTIGVVTVRIAPPEGGGERGSGEYGGEAQGPNVIAASIEAYILALNAMLGEAHWSGATEAAGSRRGWRCRPARRTPSGPSVDAGRGPRHGRLVRTLSGAWRPPQEHRDWQAPPGPPRDSRRGAPRLSPRRPRLAGNTGPAKDRLTSRTVPGGQGREARPPASESPTAGEPGP